jgi:CTP synthase
MACVEFARNVLGIPKAHSTEMDPNTENAVICLMESQKKVTQLGATMRLGSYECTLQPDSKTAHIYNSTTIHERHRHRYEFNNEFLSAFESAGFKPVGKNALTNLVEVMELQNHPFYIGVQYHPEYKSTVENPHPLFVGFVKAAKIAQEQKLKNAQNRSNYKRGAPLWSASLVILVDVYYMQTTNNLAFLLHPKQKKPTSMKMPANMIMVAELLYRSN